MSMSSESDFLPKILSVLPPDLSASLDFFCNSQQSKELVESLLRFVCGAEPPSSTTAETKSLWPERQKLISIRISIEHLNVTCHGKRFREDDSESLQAKRQKLLIRNGAPSSGALFTLHGIYATAPKRKKVDITVTTEAITFTNSSNYATEVVTPLSTLNRTFIVPTRGKSKPHWTVIFMSTDIPDTSKSANPNQQIIFGLDATSSSGFSITSFTNNSPQKTTIPKGDATLPALHELVLHSGIKLFEPSPDALMSACVGTEKSAANKDKGIPGVEGYRGTKPGTLWFFREGMLWSDSKPCEFWPVEDLLLRGINGVRMKNAAAQTCSVYITRRDPSYRIKAAEEVAEVGIETEISMVDAKERDAIEKWMRAHMHLFEKRKHGSINCPVGTGDERGGRSIETTFCPVDCDSKDLSLEGSKASEVSCGSEDFFRVEGEDGADVDQEESEGSGREDEKGSPENLERADSNPAQNGHFLLRPGERSSTYQRLR